MRARPARTVGVVLDGADGERYEVEASYTPGDPGRTYGPPEDCWPPEGPEVEWTKAWRVDPANDVRVAEVDVEATATLIGEDRLYEALAEKGADDEAADDGDDYDDDEEDYADG